MSQHSREDYIEKLRFVPKHELIYLTKGLYKDKIDDLKRNIIKTVGRKPRNTIAYVERYCNSEDLISLIDLVKRLPYKQIEDLYSEYWWGGILSLFIYRLKHPKKLQLSDIEKDLTNVFDKLNSEGEEGGLFRDFRILGTEVITNPITNKEFLEIRFYNDHRIDFINPRTETPHHIYELQMGIIYLSLKDNFFVCQVRDYRIVRQLRKLMEDLFECEVSGYPMTQAKIDSIFDTHTLMSASYRKVDLNAPLPASITASDSQLGDLLFTRSLKGVADRRRSLHNLLDFGGLDFAHNVEINRQYSKIRTTTKVKKSEALTFTLWFISKL